MGIFSWTQGIFQKSFHTEGNKERGTDGPSWLFHPSLKIQFKKKEAKSNYFLKDEESQQNSSILSLSSYNPSALPLIKKKKIIQDFLAYCIDWIKIYN